MVEQHEQQRAWSEQRAEALAWEARHRVEWERVDRKLRGVAARRAALDAEEAGLLRYGEELKLWRAFGYGSMLEYMERAMGYAPRTALERLRVARALRELPLVAEALERGALAHSAVRELSRVATAETEAVWLEAAGGKCLREIEAMVSGHRPGDLPTDPTEPRLQRRTITLEVSPETYDVWRRLHALATEEHGQRVSDDELITALYRRAYGPESRAGSPAYQIAIKQCPDCRRAHQFSGGREIEVDPRVVERAACDAVHLGSLDAAAPERATTTVTPRKRAQVLARDGHGCVVPGCRRNVGLDLHHIEYQCQGGSHALQNIISLCDLHHKSVHLGKLEIRGRAPDRLVFAFRGPRDRRNVTDDEPPRTEGGAGGASPAGDAHVGAGVGHLGAGPERHPPEGPFDFHAGPRGAGVPQLGAGPSATHQKAPLISIQVHGGAGAGARCHDSLSAFVISSPERARNRNRLSCSRRGAAVDRALESSRDDS